MKIQFDSNLDFQKQAKAKIACGKQHFKALGKDVEFAVTNAFENFSGRYVQ